MSRVISWFSCGAASAIATKMLIGEIDVIAYCETGAEHEDNKHFMADCVRWYNKPIKSIKSDKYTDLWDCWNKVRYLAGNNGARCTTEMKVKPRLKFQRPTDTHIFGYTADKADVNRAKRFKENYFELNVKFPLIEAGITKAACLAMLQTAEIKTPTMYNLGYKNNNCIPCVKATSANYWALIRETHPEEFKRMVKLSRKLNVRLCRMNLTGEIERYFIDEIPAQYPTTNPIQPSCDFMCHLVMKDF